MSKKAGDFQRGERQKEVSEQYRENWEKIFGKKSETNNK